MPKHPFSEAIFLTRKAFADQGLRTPEAIILSRGEAELFKLELKAETPELIEHWHGAYWTVVFLGCTILWPAEKVALSGGGFEFI
ncbi:MAG: hypothetical protein Q7T73_11210 [Beijerinckiaceae bacterium]|nr:hypothetical protein [Beijerinckiaceae bacterium]